MNQSGTIEFRRWLLLACAACALCLPACQGGGHLSILGYTTRPNYDESIHTVYVPIFENRTFRRGIEFDLTRAVIREIEAKTPYKVVSDRASADTELTGKIIGLNKNILNRNQLNEVREAETLLAVQVLWRDRRSGEVLSSPAQRGDLALPGMPAVEPGPGAGALPVPSDDPLPAPTPLPGGPAGACVPPPPVLIQSLGTFIPELGGSITTSEKQNVDRLAIQIVSMMERPW